MLLQGSSEASAVGALAAEGTSFAACASDSSAARYEGRNHAAPPNSSWSSDADVHDRATLAGKPTFAGETPPTEVTARDAVPSGSGGDVSVPSMAPLESGDIAAPIHRFTASRSALSPGPSRSSLSTLGSQPKSARRSMKLSWARQAV